MSINSKPNHCTYDVAHADTICPKAPPQRKNVPIPIICCAKPNTTDPHTNVKSVMNNRRKRFNGYSTIMRIAYNANATNAANDTIPKAPSISHREITAPGNPNAFCISMRMSRRASACSMIEKSFAPVKKKLMYAMTSINVTLISTIPIASRKRWLITMSRVERK